MQLRRLTELVQADSAQMNCATRNNNYLIRPLWYELCISCRPPAVELAYKKRLSTQCIQQSIGFITPFATNIGPRILKICKNRFNSTKRPNEFYSKQWALESFLDEVFESSKRHGSSVTMYHNDGPVKNLS
jgi:hypothetical protein